MAYSQRAPLESVFAANAQNQAAGGKRLSRPCTRDRQARVSGGHGRTARDAERGANSSPSAFPRKTHPLPPEPPACPSVTRYMPFNAYPQITPFATYFAQMPYKAYTSAMPPLWLQTPAQLADHLRAFRKARGLTQAALGNLVGLDQTRIAKIERDPRTVSFGQLMRLLSALQVRVLLQPTNDKQLPPPGHASDW